MELIIVFLLLVVGLPFWAAVRTLRLCFGASSDKIYIPWFLIVSAIAGLWVPFVNVLVTAYVLLVCGSVESLMKARISLIEKATPEEILELTERVIAAHNMTNDPWVLERWAETPRDQWLMELRAHDKTLREALNQKTQIHANQSSLYANWVEVLKYYEYLLKKKSTGSSIGSNSGHGGS